MDPWTYDPVGPDDCHGCERDTPPPDDCHGCERDTPPPDDGDDDGGAWEPAGVAWETAAAALTVLLLAAWWWLVS